MTEPTPPTCENCRFYLGDDDDGFCRRRAPELRPLYAEGQWPQVLAAWWCGEHEVKISLANHPTSE